LTSWAAIVLIVLVSSCFVEPLDDTTVVRMSIDLGHIELPLDDLPGPRGPDGLVHLDEVPAYVQVTVTGPGIDTPVVASWPEEGAMSPRDEVVIELEVPAGQSRQFEIIAYVHWSGLLRAWADDGSIIRNLEGGRSSDLAATLEELAYGSLQCQLVGANTYAITEVIPVDGAPEDASVVGPGVGFPRLEVLNEGFQVERVPLGRPISFYLVRFGQETVVSPSPPATLDAPDEVTDCAVIVP